MDISFYTAAVGAAQQQQRLNIHGNNIANVNTAGFRARRPSFSTLMTCSVRGIDQDVARGVGSKIDTGDADFNTVGYNDTGRYQDYAINGTGFFALLDPATGEYSYTRDGSFTYSQFKTVRDLSEVPAELRPLDEYGQPREQIEETHWYLSDGQGRFVLGRDGRPVEVYDLTSIDPLPIGVFEFSNYNGMQSVGENRLIPVEKNGQVALGTSRVVQGVLELSNADLAHEMVKVIESQRSFQYMLKMITTSDEIETTVNGLRT